MAHVYSLSEIRRLYDTLRRRFFLAVPEGTHLPPTSAELTFEWLPANSDALAITEFDEDGEPDRLRFAREFCGRSRTILRHVLLHELTHMRLGYQYSCGAWHPNWKGARVSSKMKWHVETLRLAQEGALHL